MSHHHLVLLQGGLAHLGGRLPRVEVRPKFVLRDAGDPFEIENTLGGNPAPLVNGTMRDAEFLSDLQAKPALVEKLFSSPHSAVGSTTIRRRASEMIEPLTGNLFIAPHNALMPKGKAKQGKPRHFVREWRKHRRFTLEKLAEAIGVTHGAIGQLERGEVGYTQAMLEALAHALSCDAGDLVNRNPFAQTDRSILEGLDPADRTKAIEYIDLLKMAGERKSDAA